MLKPVNTFLTNEGNNMKSRDFCYWLQGWFELNRTTGNQKDVTPETLEMIEKHLSLVFRHEIDPSMGDREHVEDLNKMHNDPSYVPFVHYSDSFLASC